VQVKPSPDLVSANGRKASFKIVVVDLRKELAAGARRVQPDLKHDLLLLSNDQTCY